MMRRILVIDDDAGFRTCLEALLEGMHIVQTAAGGLEAARRLQERFDVVILDVGLGDLVDHQLDGIDVLYYIRGRWPGTPVVVISGTPANKAQALAGGASAFFAKPVLPAAVVAAVLELGAAGFESDDAYLPTVADIVATQLQADAVPYTDDLAAALAQAGSLTSITRVLDCVDLDSSRPAKWRSRGFISCDDLRRLYPYIAAYLPKLRRRELHTVLGDVLGPFVAANRLHPSSDPAATRQ